MKTDNIILDKSMDFAVRIVKLGKYLRKEKGEYELASQMLRSGTSVGANVHEALYGYSRKEFAVKMQIALKEASETRYWLTLMKQSEILSESEYKSMNDDCTELMKLLTSIVRSSKEG